ncbi:hypothetical protein ACH5RR_021978 [Cinchona calisaya]|uniref:Uncharacterized protein n=1 Tax=Cinchona calisaya TaxID=153742 RepID=A0ABD2Z6H8_9GENT
MTPSHQPKASDECMQVDHLLRNLVCRQPITDSLPTKQQHRKSFPPKFFRAAPVWKSGDEVISVSVPRKARSAATKRSHDLINSSTTGEQIQQPSQASPARQELVTTTSTPPLPAAAAPLSPSSSNASVRKKIKPNGVKQQQRPPKSSSSSKAVSSSSNPNPPEELEIEIAEVLYGLMTQSQAQAPPPPPPTKNDSREVNRSISNDAKSRVSSPISISLATVNIQSSPTMLPAGPLSAVGESFHYVDMISCYATTVSA